MRQPARAAITTRLPGAITDTVKRPALTLITTERPALTDTIRLPGQISIVTVMRGDPLVSSGGDAAYLSGAASGEGLATGQVSATLAIGGQSQGDSLALGGVQAMAGLSGASSGEGVASGAIQGAATLSGYATGSGEATGAITVDEPGTANLSGHAAGGGLVNGEIVASADIAGNATGEGLSIGGIMADTSLSGSASGASSASGSVSAATDISGAGTGEGIASGAVLASASQAGAAQGSGLASGSIAASADIAGAATGSGSSTGAVEAKADQSGSLIGAGMAAGALSAIAGISGSAVGSGVAAGYVTAGASPPSFVALTPFVSGTGAVSPNFSSTGRTAGDLLVVEIESANQAINTMPAGWHPLPSSPQGVGTGGAAGAVRVTLFGRKSTGGETTVAVPDSGDHTTAIGHVFRGVDMSMTGNLLANSNDLNNTTYWTKYMTTVTRTGTAPDGNQANRVVMTAGDPSDYFIAPVAFNVIAGETYTYTGYCKATSGTQAFGIATFYSSTDEDTVIAASEAATTTIRRFSITFTADAADLSLYFCNPTSEAGFDIEFSNLQLFYGADAIDYEATTSAPVVNWLGVDVSAGTTQSATTSFSFPGVTTTKPNCLIAHFVANDRDAASTSNLSSITNANLTDLTKQFDQTVSTGQGGGLALITGVKASAGATGNTTATNAASNTNASITLAFAPA